MTASCIDFNAKVLCDSVHGHFGISKLEQRIINTRTFQRLKKIRHLGLASLVFTGAEHSRFAHSVGVMHIMSEMVDRLRDAKCDYVVDGGDRPKQKLRLAALLHDIGHYPMAHLGEQVFKWVDETQNLYNVYENKPKEHFLSNLLLNAGRKHKSEVAGHERLGELILTSDTSEIKKIIEDDNLDPTEIAKIFNGEHPEQVFYTQLMTSTLDCDRMDFLLRDSHSCGTPYGKIDLAYILKNIAWDSQNEYICFHPKAINAIEHFVMGRYFSYNVTYHKTIMGFELMAKALFYAMVMDKSFNSGDHTGIVHEFNDIKEKIARDSTFLANFNDEYFWYYLELFETQDPLLKDLRNNLLTRKPLRPIYHVRVISQDSGQTTSQEFDYVTKHMLTDSAFIHGLEQLGLTVERVAVLQNKISFEEISGSVPLEKIDDIDEVDRHKLIKIRTEGGYKNLVSMKDSIINVLSNTPLLTVRVYALVDKDSREETELKALVSGLCKTKA